MKKLILTLTTFLAILTWSCGGGSTQQESKDESEKEKGKSFSLSTQDGMMEVLKACEISIPENLKFIEITKESNEYSARFEAENIDETAKNQLDEWFNKQSEELISKGWRKYDVRVNESIVDSIINERILFVPGGKNLPISTGITISSSYDTKDSKYTLYVKPS